MHGRRICQGAPRKLVPLLLLSSALALPAAAQSPAPVHMPPSVHASGGGETVRAVQAGFCRAEDRRSTDRCGHEYGYLPKVKCRLPAQGELKIDTGKPATRLYASLVRPGNGPATLSKWRVIKHSQEGRRVWRLKLPSDARNAAGLLISPAYPSGDVHNWVGLDTEGCRSRK